MAATKLPFAPVDALLGVTFNPQTQKWEGTDDAAALLQVHSRTLQRWRHAGVDPWTADRIATRLNRRAWSPALWGPAWEDAADEAIEEWITAGGRDPEPPAYRPEEQHAHA